MASSTYTCSKLPQCKFCFDAKEFQTDAINLANYCAICRACLKHTTQCRCSKQNGHVISATGALDYGIEFENDNDITELENDGFNKLLFLDCNYHDIASINNHASNNYNDLLLMHFNTRSLQKNIDKLTHYILQLKKLSDIIAITETKLKKDELQTNIGINGYNFIHSDSDSQAGGVGLYIKNSISYKIINELDLKLNFVENIWIEVETNKKSIAVGVVYRHPGYLVNQI